MDIRCGNRYPSGKLSNFTEYQFIFRGVQCNSVEGVLQSLKFDNVKMQQQICLLTGLRAKHRGRHKGWWKTQTLWWDGKPIKRDSDQYQELLDDIYVSLFTQNKKARQALLATNDAVLTHRIGKKRITDTILTEQEFVSRLMIIRTIFRNEC